MCRPSKRTKPVSNVPAVGTEMKLELNLKLNPFFANLKDTEEKPVAVLLLSELLSSSEEEEEEDINENSSKDLLDRFQPLMETNELPKTVVVSAEHAESSVMMEADFRPKTFVFTAYEMLSNLENSEAVGFTPDGNGVEIRDTVLFSEKILPNYFRHKNIPSFYRQLNSHGFRTIRSVSLNVVHTFSHDFFKRGHPELLSLIVRKMRKPRESNHLVNVIVTKESSTDGNLTITSSSSSTSDDASTKDSSDSECDGTEKKSNNEKSEKKVLEELRQRAEEHAVILEARNRQLIEENRSILAESERISNLTNQMVNYQTNVIENLFGVDASRCFTGQLTPFKSDFELACMQASRVVSQGSNSKHDENLLFTDEDLNLLENIITAPIS